MRASQHRADLSHSGDDGVTSGHREFDSGTWRDGGAFTVLGVQEELEVIWGRKVILVQDLLTLKHHWDIQETTA